MYRSHPTPGGIQVRDVYAEVTGRIINMLNSGTIPWRKPWNAAPTNYISRRPYRGVNIWLLDCDYASPYWLTYKQAKKAGGHVKRGERGTQIIYWNFIDRESTNDEGEVEMRRIPLLRYYTVFNMEQCSDIKVDTNAVEVVTPAEEVIDGYINVHDEPPQLKYGGNVAAYIPMNDVVKIPHRDTFTSPAGYYSTMFHELVHSTGHKSRLNRTLDTQFASSAYSNEELIAEMGAAYLCAISDTKLVANSIDNMAAYIGHWKSKLEEDKRLIVRISGQAQKAVDWVLGHREVLPERQ